MIQLALSKRVSACMGFNPCCVAGRPSYSFCVNNKISSSVFSWVYMLWYRMLSTDPSLNCTAQNYNQLTYTLYMWAAPAYSMPQTHVKCRCHHKSFGTKSDQQQGDYCLNLTAIIRKRTFNSAEIKKHLKGSSPQHIPRSSASHYKPTDCIMFAVATGS